MIKTLAARLIAFALTALAATIVLFVAINIVPGSAAQSALGIDATPQAIARFEAQHALDRPWVEQYWDWLRGAVRGDLGRSFQSGAAVGPQLAERIPVTIELAVLAFLVANMIAIPLGLAATSRRRGVDQAARILGAGTSAMPSFWLATLLVLLFSLKLQLLPPSGFTPLSVDPIQNLQRMIMPALALGAVSSGVLFRIMRSSMLDALSSHYVLTAAAKGAGRREVVRRHAFRNALVPYLHVGAVELTFLFGGVVVIEDIFRLPGVGSLVLVGIINRDYPVLLAASVTVTLFALTANLIADVAATLVDPRPVRGAPG